MASNRANRKLMKSSYKDEEEFLKKMKGLKVLPCEEPLHKTVSRNPRNKVGKGQDGGFVQFLVPLISALGPTLVDYAVKKFTGNGIAYVKQVGNSYEPISLSEKKHILYNILTEYPHLFDEIFK